MRSESPPLARLLVSAGALLVVGIPAYFVVVHGTSIDLDALVYAIPISAVAFAVLASIGHRLVAVSPVTPVPPTAAAAWRVGRHPSLHLAICVAGLAVTTAIFFVDDADTSAYNADPSCSGNLTYVAPQSGACSVQAARIVDAWTTSSRRSTHRNVRVAFADGSQATVTLAGSYAAAFWRAATYGTDRSASVQWYRGRIVALTDPAGRAETDLMPAARLASTFYVAIALAAFGLISSARILFFA